MTLNEAVCLEFPDSEMRSESKLSPERCAIFAPRGDLEFHLGGVSTRFTRYLHGTHQVAVVGPILLEENRVVAGDYCFPSPWTMPADHAFQLDSLMWQVWQACGRNHCGQG